MTLTLEITGKVFWGVRKSPLRLLRVCKGAGTEDTIVLKRRDAVMGKHAGMAWREFAFEAQVINLLSGQCRALQDSGMEEMTEQGEQNAGCNSK